MTAIASAVMRADPAGAFESGLNSPFNITDDDAARSGRGSSASSFGTSPSSASFASAYSHGSRSSIGSLQQRGRRRRRRRAVPNDTNGKTGLKAPLKTFQCTFCTVRTRNADVIVVFPHNCFSLSCHFWRTSPRNYSDMKACRKPSARSTTGRGTRSLCICPWNNGFVVLKGLRRSILTTTKYAVYLIVWQTPTTHTSKATTTRHVRNDHSMSVLSTAKTTCVNT